MRCKLLHGCTLVETEQVDLIVHSSECIRTLTKSACCRKPTLRDKEALLCLQVRRTDLLYETIHRRCHTHERFDGGLASRGLHRSWVLSTSN